MFQLFVQSFFLKKEEKNSEKGVGFMLMSRIIGWEDVKKIYFWKGEKSLT